MIRSSLAISAVLLALLPGCADSGTITFENKSASTAQQVELNIVKTYGRGEFQTQPHSEFDQLLKLGSVPPGESRTAPYTSLSEGIIDVRVTWSNGRIARYNVGYVDDLFSASHVVTATDEGLLFDGKSPHPVQSDPEANFGKYAPPPK